MYDWEVVMAMEQGPQPGEAIFSAFSDDEDMRELVEYFVSELGTRVQDMSKAWEQANADQIRVFAHQLKGSAAGYGFDSIGTAAGRLESAINSISSPNKLSGIESQFRELLDLCQRATLGFEQEPDQ
jgi:HPt (histidine-containing phosphotransfer) domain-containing protein